MLAADPSGKVLRGDDVSPWTGLVESGWTEVLYQTGVNQEGNVTLKINTDLSPFNVMAIQFKGGATTIGTTYDNIQFVQQTAPVAVGDSFNIKSSATVSGNVLDNDSDAINDTISVIEVAGEPEVGTAVTIGSGATVNMASDGTFTYDPEGLFDYLAANETGHDSFTYTVTDGKYTSTATVSITLTGLGFSDWADESGYTIDFSADDNGDGQVNGFDYIFGEEEPLVLSSSLTLNEPASVPADVTLHLRKSNDLVEWTTILTYTGGAISYQDPEVTLDGGVITYNTSDGACFTVGLPSSFAR